MNPKVDWFFSKAKQWQAEFKQLRTILLECELTEELKWGVPCYTSQSNNIVLIHGFKEYCAVLFHKGALLTDAQGILVQQTQNVQSARQIRFTSPQEIMQLADTLKDYIFEAIKIEKLGLKIEYKKTTEFVMPEEFLRVLEQNPALETAFDSLTPGRQRAYLLYFSAPKQAKTRVARVEKYTQQILLGKGLND
jgi:uncharacterized protein YdeI (YjbR/CyaY-like superfamily)